MQIQLAAEAVERLMRPVRGKGGFQTLLRRLQHQVNGSVLTVSASDYEKLVRYSTTYGGGGFQTRTQSTTAGVQQSLNFSSE